MQIKTQEGTENVASAGVGGSALGIGIGALSLAVLQGLNGGNGGVLGGLLGGCNNGVSPVNFDSRIISSLESELAKEKAERYADNVGIATFKEAKTMSDKNDEKINANYKELAQFVAALDKRTAVAEAVNFERLNCLSNRVTALEGVTKLVVPNSAICPGWGDVTVSPATTTTTGA